MGCGCGGSKKAERPLQQQRRRDSGSQNPRPAVSFTDYGFTWTGPVRPVEPAKP
jgi:hypothetical protein